jgi:hypothetical protein
MTHSYRIETTLTEDSKLSLEGLPFQAGKKVEIIVSDQSQSESFNAFPLQGSVLHYDHPFEPAISADDWNVLK